MRILGIADDLTGALEAGALLGTEVRFAGPLPESRSVVVDTESRHLSPDNAAKTISDLAAECRRADLIYKKTDSTLRGNIEAEIRALAHILDGTHTAYIPAYPAMGRTVREGRLYVHGIPLEATEFKRDPLNPVTDGRVPDLMACEVFDGETDEHVAQSVHQALLDRRRIIAGPASVARELARQLSLSPAPTAQLPAIRTCLVVNGSLHNRSALQMQIARDAGLFADAWRESPSRIGNDVSALLATFDPDAVIVFGGDTAFDAVRALRYPALYPLGEIVMGVPFSRIEGHRTILITKAGGFGRPDLLIAVARILYDKQ